MSKYSATTPLEKLVVAAILLPLLVLAVGISFGGCKDATRAQFSAQGHRHRVTLYNGGQAVRTWIATGNPKNEAQSDGWYFKDEASGKLVEVTGALVFEVMD